MRARSFGRRPFKRFLRSLARAFIPFISVAGALMLCVSLIVTFGWIHLVIIPQIPRP